MYKEMSANSLAHCGAEKGENQASVRDQCKCIKKLCASYVFVGILNKRKRKYITK
ncbi:hypothetical protein COEREDRAFT_93510 [Coemansia reversa NRRL 1564]|uniref:Uncharacterized protein n=1 Tax=Coemansia reversa (strain ATCC 12441 / NRRL 1564) TaxID=763665 RepID=A0A2G5B7R2_COERN|nr:hypothetical protein COEREDRAFT_93510 [Coemansia reversa NRRL 1564]|eukprot:PIA15083.1 hypothetical protein COEREDRAFT_93510 [Coemansia reversa NRRL 1564]